MIEIEVKGGHHPEALAELIASVNGDPVAHPEAQTAGMLIREQQEAAESRRPSHQEMETVNFQRLETDLDWTDV